MADETPQEIQENMNQLTRFLRAHDGSNLPVLLQVDQELWLHAWHAAKKTNDLCFIELGPLLTEKLKYAGNGRHVGLLAERGVSSFVPASDEDLIIETLDNALSSYASEPTSQSLAQEFVATPDNSIFAFTFWMTVRDRAMRSRSNCASVFNLSGKIIEKIAQLSPAVIFSACTNSQSKALRNFRLTCPKEDCVHVLDAAGRGDENAQCIAQLKKANHCASYLADSKKEPEIRTKATSMMHIVKSKVDDVLSMLKENKQAQEIANELYLNTLFVKHIENEWMRRELYEKNELSKTIADIQIPAEETKKMTKKMAQIANTRRQLVIILEANGMTMPQIAVVTKISANTIGNTVRPKGKTKNEAAENSDGSPSRISKEISKKICSGSSLFGRIILTLFVNHYRKIHMQSMHGGEGGDEEDQHALHLKKIVEACQRTRDVVVQIRLVPMFDKLLKHTRHRQFFDHDPRYLSLGTLLPIATQLDRQWSLPEKILADFNSRNIPAPEEFIVEEVCPNPGCGERFAYSIKNTEAAGKCPFCDLKSRFEKAFKTQA